jgi:hypothetical protein
MSYNLIAPWMTGPELGETPGVGCGRGGAVAIRDETRLAAIYSIVCYSKYW